MGQERMQVALSRIEKSLERLERISLDDKAAEDLGTSDLARERAAEALRSLDTLITELKSRRG